MKNIKLWHGDCLDIMKGLDENSVDVIITDPPYDFNRDQINEFQFEMRRVCKEKILVFSPPENQWYPSTLDNIQYHFWIKPISTKNTRKNPSRFVEIAQVEGDGIWNYGRHWSQYTNVHTDIIEYNKNHPYRKPISLIRRFILNYTNPDYVVLDPFMGSGTTGEGCVQLGRTFYGIEQNETYFNLAGNNIKNEIKKTK